MVCSGLSERLRDGKDEPEEIEREEGDIIVEMEMGGEREAGLWPRMLTTGETGGKEVPWGTGETLTWGATGERLGWRGIGERLG